MKMYFNYKQENVKKKRNFYFQKVNNALIDWLEQWIAILFCMKDINSRCDTDISHNDNS